MNINDIVKVRELDYSSVPTPTEAEEKKKHKAMIKELTSLSGKVFKIISKHTIEEQNFVVIDNLEKKKIMLGDTEHAITLLEDEVEVVETDYLNNCCISQLGTMSISDSYTCETCGFNIGTLLNRADENKTSKTKSKKS